MKKLIIIGLMLISLSAFSQPFGYFIWIRDTTETVEGKFPDIAEAQDFISGKMRQVEMFMVPILSDVLENSVLFEQRNQYVWVYCEKMRIVHKRNGKVKYKRIKIKGNGKYIC